MKLCVLGSGSRGNAVYVESGETAVLVDAGFSARELKRRMEAQGLELSRLSALVISHEHGDHIQGLLVLGRRLPVYATEGTLEALEEIYDLDGGTEVMAAGEWRTIGALRFRPVPVSHDAADPVGFVIEDGHARAAVITDLGVVTRLVQHSLADLSIAVIEANHDPEMLIAGPYPWEVKQRVKSRLGHLANHEAADLITGIAHSGLKHVLLAHLSQINNRPQLAHDAVGAGLDQSRTRLHVCRQDRPSPIIKI